MHICYLYGFLFAHIQLISPIKQAYISIQSSDKDKIKIKVNKIKRNTFQGMDKRIMYTYQRLLQRPEKKYFIVFHSQTVSTLKI